MNKNKLKKKIEDLVDEIVYNDYLHDENINKIVNLIDKNKKEGKYEKNR